MSVYAWQVSFQQIYYALAQKLDEKQDWRKGALFSRENNCHTGRLEKSIAEF